MQMKHALMYRAPMFAGSTLAQGDWFVSFLYHLVPLDVRKGSSIETRSPAVTHVIAPLHLRGIGRLTSWADNIFAVHTLFGARPTVSAEMFTRTTSTV